MNYERAGFKLLMGIGVFSLFIISRIVIDNMESFTGKEIKFLSVYFIVAMFCIISGRYMISKLDKQKN